MQIDTPGDMSAFSDKAAALVECHKHYARLRTEMDKWLLQSMILDPPGATGGGEDEANYALAWISHYLVTGNEQVMRHFGDLIAQLEGWVARECVHGYEPEAEAHHGTEPFALFLPRYIGLRRDDARAIKMLDDAAEHIGNWVADIPPWYDYERDVFRGYWLGTRTVRDDKPAQYETAEHFRFIHIALAAHRYTGKERYLDWALRYGRARARRIVESPNPLPLLWDLDEKGLWEDEVYRRRLRPMASGSHHLPGDTLVGVENLLASGAIYALGDLYRASRDTIFEIAARRIVEPLIDVFLDPYADPGVAAIGYYRLTFGDKRFDERLSTAIEGIPAQSPQELVLVFPHKKARRGRGVGRRADMIYWGTWEDDGRVEPTREPTTAALTLAYQLTGNPRFAAQALEAAATRLETARRLLRGGREHSDMGCAICSVAAGHGRNWGQGSVTACYGPLILGTRDLAGEVSAVIDVRAAGQPLGLPEAVLCLARPLPDGSAEASLSNHSKEPQDISWRRGGSNEPWHDLRLEPDATCIIGT